MNRDALRERIELVEGRRRGAPVRVLNLRLRKKHALADILVNGARKSNQKYLYRDFFLARQLKLGV